MDNNDSGIVFSFSIHILQQGGLIDLWLAKEITNVSQCLLPPSADRSTAIAALNVEALTGSFLLLMGGEGRQQKLE